MAKSFVFSFIKQIVLGQSLSVVQCTVLGLLFYTDNEQNPCSHETDILGIPVS